MAASLTPRDRVVLMALMALNRKVDNRTFKERAGLTLEGDARRRLNDAGLVVSDLRNRRYHHEVTGKGWDWCWDEMARSAPTSRDTGTRALYAVLAGMRRFMERRDLKLSEVFGLDPLEERIRNAYRSLATMPDDWVGLAKLRDLLNGASHDEVDAALRRLARQPDVHLAPETDQAALTPADRAAAIDIGDRPNHLLKVDLP